MAQPRLRGAPVLSCERSRTKEGTDHPCLYKCTCVRARARARTYSRPSFLSPSLSFSFFGFSEVLATSPFVTLKRQSR